MRHCQQDILRISKITHLEELESLHGDRVEMAPAQQAPLDQTSVPIVGRVLCTQHSEAIKIGFQLYPKVVVDLT
jgi:hypothetical protein